MASVLRAATALTSAYVAYTYKNSGESNQVSLLVEYTKGDETTAEIKVEVSPDQVTFYRVPTEAAASGVITVIPAVWQLSETENYVIALPNAYDHLRISVKATGGTPTGTMALSIDEKTV
jgi:hypothetical protein